LGGQRPHRDGRVLADAECAECAVAAEHRAVLLARADVAERAGAGPLPHRV
jgi:hypothetical protein